jgi:hypothetical protein
LTGVAFIQDRRLCADGFCPRAIGDPRGRDAGRASAINTDRPACLLQPVAFGCCALSRANREFGTDKKRIRTKFTVLDKSKRGLDAFFRYWSFKPPFCPSLCL